ncbi:transcription factor PAR1-like [Senna tora]|uniref:Transcription factor PAR1-like n=1 Tax=Senna tora TaxID=362788 RepID=A0A834W4E2_9FABA|nr:transcription factor PAR1-like [Senna tora]
MGCKDMCKVKWRRRQEAGVVQRKVKKLQRLIPGATGLKADRLFLRTAQHILHLRLQLNLLQALSNTLNFKP